MKQRRSAEEESDILRRGQEIVDQTHDDAVQPELLREEEEESTQDIRAQTTSRAKQTRYTPCHGSISNCFNKRRQRHTQATRRAG
jgi:hypothetical protein